MACGASDPMNPEQADDWKDAVLNDVFEAIAASEALNSILIFKGARVLARYLPDTARQSLDIDANCTKEFLERFPERASRAEWIERELAIAISRHFEAQNPVTKALDSVRVSPQPPKAHPLGWDAFEVRFRINDLGRASQRGVPALQLDIASPEALTEHSTSKLSVGAQRVRAYTLERITGEKLRAFLSSTPAHQEKIARTGVLRVKDLYDLARIVASVQVEPGEFWNQVCVEFRMACESRGVSCSGWTTFDAVADLAKGLYDKEPTLPKDLSFEVSWAAVKSIVNYLERQRVTPFEFPLPLGATAGSVGKS